MWLWRKFFLARVFEFYREVRKEGTEKDSSVGFFLLWFFLPPIAVVGWLYLFWFLLVGVFEIPYIYCKYFFHPQKKKMKILARQLRKLKKIRKELPGDTALEAQIQEGEAELEHLWNLPRFSKELYKRTQVILAENRRREEEKKERSRREDLEPAKQEVLKQARETMEELREELAFEQQAAKEVEQEELSRQDLSSTTDCSITTQQELS